MIDRFPCGLYTLAVVLAQLDHVTTHMSLSLWDWLLGVYTRCCAYTVEELATQLTAQNDEAVTGVGIAHLFPETSSKLGSGADGWLLAIAIARGVRRLPLRLRDSVKNLGTRSTQRATTRRMGLRSPAVGVNRSAIALLEHAPVTFSP